MEFGHYEIPVDSDLESEDDGPELIRDTFEGATPAPHAYIVNGITIEFPFKAYDCQKDMMKKIIKAVDHGEGRGKNCLLESPTGTGKTLSILCSMLAWQNHRRKSIKKKQKQDCRCGLYRRISKEGRGKQTKVRILVPKDSYDCCSSHQQSFQRNASNSQAETDEWENLLKQFCKSCRNYIDSVDNIPKIIYATRTHSQIAGVIKQLKKTEYKNVKMSILSSRKQTCIYKAPEKDLKDKTSIDLDDQCATLRQNFHDEEKGKNNIAKGCCRVESDDGTDSTEATESEKICQYYNGSKEKTVKSLEEACWDIEDLVKAGKESSVCPYYAARALNSVADIVFCPYNYILHSNIRKAVSLDLENTVLVFDEAHNIETICRDMTSSIINLKKLDEIIRGIDKLFRDKAAHDITFIKNKSDENGLEGETDKPLRILERYSSNLKRMSKWIRQKQASAESEISNFKSHDEAIQSEEILNQFKYFGFGPETLDEHSVSMDFLKDVTVKYPIDIPEEQHCKISSEFIKFINKLDGVLKKLYKMKNNANGTRYTIHPDYKVIFSIQPQKRPTNSPGTSNGGCNDMYSPKAKRARKTETTESGRCFLSILCLNPAIGFKDIRKPVHSLIVTSGTLSPLSSFAYELETNFPIQLQAKHVIPETNAFICSVSHGPSGQLLCSVKNNWNFNPNFQDDIGESVLGIAQTVSNGILVFFPSYQCMYVMEKRWVAFPTDNPLMSKLQNEDILIYWETNSNDKTKQNSEFSRKQINDFKEKTKNGRKCIFFGVFRGKLSEGTDFTDNEARAVVTVGIPLLPFNAPEILYKKKYNDEKYRSNNDYLPGNEWYTVSAMRAFNQALGRCIRHANDWGTIIMLDSRISQQSVNALAQYKSKLPNWVTTEGLYKGDYNNFDIMISHLKNFFDSKLQT